MGEEREKKCRAQTGSERREKKYKTLFTYTTYVRTVANLQPYEHKWYNFGTYTMSDGS